MPKLIQMPLKGWLAIAVIVVLLNGAAVIARPYLSIANEAATEMTEERNVNSTRCDLEMSGASYEKNLTTPELDESGEEGFSAAGLEFATDARTTDCSLRGQ